MSNKLTVGLALFLIASSWLCQPFLANTLPSDSFAGTTDRAVRTRVLEAYGKLPLLFIQNQGQLNDRVKYYVKTSGQTLYFTDESVVFDLIRYQKTEEADLTNREAERLVFSLTFLAGKKSPVIEGRDKDKAVVNYFIGNDPRNGRLISPLTGA